ncbi:MAG: ABC transporter ATP-binding protein [Thermodesulfovibrionales bacterium]
MASVPAFQAAGLAKEFRASDGSVIRALDDVSFEAAESSITCIVGPTGSGKSTVLRILSGLEAPSSGSASVSGGPPAGIRAGIGYLTQRHTLFPWLRVEENIGLPLEAQGADAAARRREVERIAGLLGIGDTLSRFPHELSGGMQQRAALGRLLATGTRYWLMDEPFSALDDRTTHQLQRLLVRLSGEHGISVLFVTHSIDEAVYLADRIVVLSAGPGRTAGIFDIDLERPRDRLAPAFGGWLEQVRRRIESVIDEPEGARQNERPRR